MVRNSSIARRVPEEENGRASLSVRRTLERFKISYGTLSRLRAAGKVQFGESPSGHLGERCCSEEAARTAVNEWKRLRRSQRIERDGEHYISRKLFRRLFRQQLKRNIDHKTILAWETKCKHLDRERGLKSITVGKRKFHRVRDALEIIGSLRAQKRTNEYGSPDDPRITAIEGHRRFGFSHHSPEAWERRCVHLPTGRLEGFDDAQGTRKIRTYRVADLQAIDEARRENRTPSRRAAGWDGVFEQLNDDRRLTLQLAGSRVGLRVAFLHRCITRGNRYFPIGDFADRRRPPATHGRLRLQWSVLESAARSLKEAIVNASAAVNPHGWLDVKDIAAELKVQGFAASKVIPERLRSARESGAIRRWVRPQVPIPVRGGYRGRPHLYDPAEALPYLRRVLSGEHPLEADQSPPGRARVLSDATPAGRARAGRKREWTKLLEIYDRLRAESPDSSDEDEVRNEAVKRYNHQYAGRGKNPRAARPKLAQAIRDRRRKRE